MSRNLRARLARLERDTIPEGIRFIDRLALESGEITWVVYEDDEWREACESHSAVKELRRQRDRLGIPQDDPIDWTGSFVIDEVLRLAALAGPSSSPVS